MSKQQHVRLAMARTATGLVLAASALSGVRAHADGETWRYYRLGNTGIQGDYNDALWIGPDGDPYIGGYDPVFEEGGFVKFIQSEDRWVNYSNVDYPVIGHPDETGCVRIRDIVPDATGRLWLGTWHGALTFDRAIGGSSLVRLGPGNSGLLDEQTYDIDRAPDGTMWFVNGGVARYNPATDTWSRWPLGAVFMSVQPKAAGGYLVWSSERPPFQDYTFIFDSTTQQWTTIDITYPHGSPGDVAGMPGKDCVDDVGNFWALRLRNAGDYDALDYRRPDGTWISKPEPYYGVTFDISAFTAYGNGRALLVDGNGQVFRFDGSAWASLGAGSGVSANTVDVDGAGNIWVCGVGGAAKRNAQTGQWQRYRVTNTSNFDDFNRDLTIDPVHGYVYTGANAGPGVGGMVRFDGTRWTCWDQLTYGLGYDWPFANDYCQALAHRPSSGRVAVSPLNWLYGIHEWTGSAFVQLPPLSGAQRMCEDSQGRLWAIGEYFSLGYHDGSGWTSVPIVGWGTNVRPDPTRPGTVWANTGYQLLRTDGGAYTFARTIADFVPPLWDNTDTFTGLAVAADGIAWVGATALYDGPTPGGALIRIDADTGEYQMLRKSQGWPFPGDVVTPWVVTPDGRLWMQYDDLNYPYDDVGLCWYDGTNVGRFPAPPGGEPQWGGLPHKQIEDMEVRVLPDHYELWMSCVSRGIAVLSVPYQNPVAVRSEPAPVTLALEQNRPNPFRTSTQLGFSLPHVERVRFSVHDVGGRLVRILLDREMSAGRHEVAWDGRDAENRAVASGVYFYTLERAGQELQRKMVVLR
ncbi:MAG: FlgD immunoglobulin-like domain containing protein [bacterium]